MTRSGRALGFSLAALFVCGAIAVAAPGRPRLIPIADSSLVNVRSSNPREFYRIGALVYFTANDGVNGEELWRTDGTAAGTVMLTGIGSGSTASVPTIGGQAGNHLVFMMWEPSGASVWTTDGTVAGTSRLVLLPQRDATFPDNYYVRAFSAGDRVYVLVQVNYHHVDLWVTDGTVNGIAEIGWLDADLDAVGVNGKLLFKASDPIVGLQLWTSDGTLLGTHMLRRSIDCPGEQCNLLPRDFFRIGTKAFFTTSDGVWTSDGTLAGTTPVFSAAGPGVYATSGSVAYITAGNSLFRTDGTAAGTVSMPVAPGDTIVSAWYREVLDDGRLVVIRYVGDGYELWKSDATAAGTARIFSFTYYDSHGSLFVGHIANSVLFQGYDSNIGWELWSANADTAAAGLVKDIDDRLTYTGPLSSDPGPGISLDSAVLFAANSIVGNELWRTDGTPPGTWLLANIAAEAPSGMISGTVRDAATGNGIPGASFAICGSKCDTGGLANASGDYRIEGVAPGTYTMYAASRNYLTGCFGGTIYPCGNSIPVTVTAGYETTPIDFSLTRGGRITGAVTRASTGNTVGGFSVLIRDTGGKVVDQPYNTPYGAPTYMSRALPAGTYYVETYHASWSGFSLVDQVYQGHECVPACDWTKGDPVSVTLGSDTTANFALRDNGTIAGTIRDASSGAGAPSMQVSFVLQGYTGTPASTLTRADGTYASPPLVSGMYYVRVEPGSGYNGLVYPNAPCPSFQCDPSAGTPVSVAVATATTGIDLALAEPEGRITGVIRDRSGNPFPNVSVTLLDGSGGNTNYASMTDLSGRYTMYGVASGTYYLRVIDELYPNIDCFYLPCTVGQATGIAIAAGQTTTVDMQSRSMRATVAGHVTRDGTASIVWQSTVQLFTAAGNPIVAAQWNNADTYLLTVMTRQSGFYVAASAPGFHSMWYPNVPGAMNCSPCSVPAGSVLVSPGSTGIDFVLPRYGSISGNVVDVNSGKPIAYTTVMFYSGTTTAGWASTDDAGHYVWQNANGIYTAVANGDYNHHDQIYKDHDCATTCDPSTGDPINAPDGSSVTNIDFHLQPTVADGKISGRVVDDATGLPLQNVYVSTAAYPWVTARTDAQGNYTLEADPLHQGSLKTGQYYVYAQAGAPYFVSLYGGATCPDSSCNLSGGVPVQVNAPNTTTGIDFRLIKLQISSIAPTSGPAAGGTQVIVTGTNFAPQTTLKIAGIPATITSISPAQIVATTPAGPGGPAHVTAYASASLSVTLAHGFTYMPPLFTDDPIVPGTTTIKAIHLMELRSAVNRLRLSASLSEVQFSDGYVTAAGMTIIRAAHILELRTALDQARAALSLPALTYAHTLTAGESPINATDVMQLRDALR